MSALTPADNATPSGQRPPLCYGTFMSRKTTGPMPLARPALLALALPAVLTACASGGAYPSVAKRPAEQQYIATEPSAPVALAVAVRPTSDDLAAKLASLQARAQKTHRQFQSQEGNAARAVTAARGAAVASEAWSIAQVALAELDSTRSSAMIALADLDSLLVEAARANAESPTADLAAVQRVRAVVIGWIADEDEALSSLRGRLRG